MKNFPVKKCYRVLYKIVCIHCRNHTTKTTYRTHCKFGLGACLKFYINCLVSGANTTLNILVIFAVVQTLRWQRRCYLQSLGVQTNGTPWINIAKLLKLMSPLSRQRGLHKMSGFAALVDRVVASNSVVTGLPSGGFLLHCTVPDTPIRWTLRVVICHFQSWTFFYSL